MLRRTALGMLIGGTVALALAGQSRAADPSLLIGKWIEKLPDGAGAVTEFTATTMATYGVDTAGAPTGKPKIVDVTYRNLGESIAITVVGGDGLLAVVRNQNAIVLEFPGAGGHQLKRMLP